MTYNHGVNAQEVPSSIRSVSTPSSSIPVVFGTAPVEQSKLTTQPINEPILCLTYDEAVNAFGYDEDWDKYTLCEFMYSHFKLYQGGPVVLVNVFDPVKHATTEVAAVDIIGGTDVTTGKATGLELINQIFPRYRIIPGVIVVPKFSADPQVATVMNAKASNINAHFKSIALTDIPTDINKNYSDVPTWKTESLYNDTNQIACWPKVSQGDKQFFYSTHLAGVIMRTDADHDGVPYVSPSNKKLYADGTVLADGTPVFLGPEQAAYLNGNGIVTALNFINGWKAWGNRTAAFPEGTDPKDTFIPLRRMFNWIHNTVILTFWQKLDGPITKRLIESIVDNLNLWFNGLTARGMILGGRVEFIPEENPEADLIDGKIKFHIYATPPSPAREISFLIEYDAQYIGTLVE